MAKQDLKQEENEKDRKLDLIVKIILIIIIIILLLHNCVLLNKKGSSKTGNVNIIDITCDDNKCDEPVDTVTVDCLQDENNKTCLVPDFVGKTKKDVLKWLNKIANNIEIEIKTTEDENIKDGTVLIQSISGVSIKDLISGKYKLVITIANNGSLVDCEKNPNNSKCVLPDFVGDTKSAVEKWLNKLTNNVKVKYVYVDSNKRAGTIISQSIQSGKSIKELLDNGETVILYISKGKNVNPNTGPDSGPNITPVNPDSGGDQGEDDEPSDEPLDDDFYVSDNEIVKWQDENVLNIFEDSSNISKVHGKIAPESSGTYKFIVNNGTGYNLNYKITFLEAKDANINMKFKLKKNDTYLVDHYVSYNSLDLDNMLLNSKTSDTYYLEWKWIGDDDNTDTSIGKSAKDNNIEYSLKINVEAESV